jgi:hypothetical protein
VKRLPHPQTQLVVGDGTPEHGLAVHDRLGLDPGRSHRVAAVVGPPAAASATVCVRTAIGGRGSIQAAVGSR